MQRSSKTSNKMTNAAKVSQVESALLYIFSSLEFAFKPRLDNLQRFCITALVSFYLAFMYTPLSAVAQNNSNPLGAGAGQTTNNQCSRGFWFMQDINSFITSTFGGLGGADEFFCQIMNIVIFVSVFGTIFVVLWGVADHMGNSTPVSKAFKPLVGWIVAIMVVWMIIGVTFVGIGIGNNGGNAAGGI